MLLRTSADPRNQWQLALSTSIRNVKLFFDCERELKKLKEIKKKAGPLYDMYIFMETTIEFGFSQMHDNYFLDRVKKLKDLFNQISFACTVMLLMYNALY